MGAGREQARLRVWRVVAVCVLWGAVWGCVAGLLAAGSWLADDVWLRAFIGAGGSTVGLLAIVMIINDSVRKGRLRWFAARPTTKVEAKDRQ